MLHRICRSQSHNDTLSECGHFKTSRNEPNRDANYEKVLGTLMCIYQYQV